MEISLPLAMEFILPLTYERPTLIPYAAFCGTLSSILQEIPYNAFEIPFTVGVNGR